MPDLNILQETEKAYKKRPSKKESLLWGSNVGHLLLVQKNRMSQKVFPNQPSAQQLPDGPSWVKTAQEPVKLGQINQSPSSNSKEGQLWPWTNVSPPPRAYGDPWEQAAWGFLQLWGLPFLSWFHIVYSVFSFCSPKIFLPWAIPLKSHAKWKQNNWSAANLVFVLWGWTYGMEWEEMNKHFKIILYMSWVTVCVGDCGAGWWDHQKHEKHYANKRLGGSQLLGGKHGHPVPKSHSAGDSSG